MKENLADEIRKTIESIKDMKIQVGGINNYLSTIENLVRKDIMEQVDEAYQKGYDKGYADKTNNDEVCKQIAKDIQDEAYQRGLDDAWEVAKKVVLNPDDGGLSILELNEIFNCATIQQVFRKYTLSEVIAKLKAYEEKQNNKFEFGDEIIGLNGIKGCVVSKDNEGYNTMYALFDECRVPQDVTQSNYRKTGKHYDIEKILEEMKK